jgi:hypothetical protein
LTKHRALPAFVSVALGLATVASAQSRGAPSEAAGRQLTGIPAVNFDSDEGFGYGAIVQAYDYRPGAAPYVYTIQPTLFFTTKGRRDW